MRREKSYEELTLADDFMFCKVMMTNPDLCKELVELIIGQKIKEIVILNEQKTIKITDDSRGIRLDVYMEDELNTVYDIEMQTGLKNDLPKRTRYYQGMIDLNMISQGSTFKSLKKSYIIFICTFDPFGYKRHIYTFENACNELPELKLRDDSVKIFLNSEGKTDDVSLEMDGFLKLLTGKPSETKLARKLENAVEKVKRHKEWRTEYMTLLMRDNEIREEGIEIGRLLMLFSLVNNNTITLKDASASASLSEEEFLRKMKEYQETSKKL